MKSGWKTTEFWLTLLATAISGAYASGVIAPGTTPDKAIGIATLVLGVLGYNVSRGLAKTSKIDGSTKAVDQGT